MNRVPRPVLALALAAGAVGPCLAGWDRVPVEVILPPKIETTPGERVLVTLARADEHPLFNIGREVTRWLRREIARGTALEVLDVTPPQIPEQRPEKLAVNDVFWKRLGQDFDADLVVAAIADFRIEDRSGFVTEDYVSDLTGQTVRRTVFRDRTGYGLRLQVFFLKGDNGALLHMDTWQEERVLEGNEREDLHVLFQLLDMFKDDLLGTLVASPIAEPRFIWVE
ncbi:MAG: hypothetical protein Q9Q40_10265 [Acidobacteriota bacterium]|nr:hypothetical protein [Acidobacteriota bacterium]MDQ7088746.1 hypothetical protein [Acidobacteriota bacterium]